MIKKLTTTLIMILLLAACAGGDTSGVTEVGDFIDGSGEPASGAPGTTAAGAAAPEEQDDAGTVEIDLGVVSDRKVIRQASLTLQADDTRRAYDRIVELTETAGGFVAGAEVRPVSSEDDQPSIVMTVRIPAAELRTTMVAIKGSVEEVLSESQGAQDVTDQFIDFEARLANLEALEVELRALLAEVSKQPDADPDKLLRVYSEISNVRGQIEQIQGQLNYLDDAVTLATLQIDLTPTPAVVPIVEDTWEPIEVARDSLRSLVSGLQGIAEWGINFALFTLPMLLLVLGLPALVAFVAYRWWKSRHPAPPPVPPTPTEA
jgi:hypothetical protein